MGFFLYGDRLICSLFELVVGEMSTPRLGERNWGTYKSPNDQVREDDYKEHSSTPPPSQPLEQHLLKPRKTTTNKHPQRGGAGNISTPRHGTPDPTSHSHAPHAPHLTSAHAPSSGRSSTDVIPEPALRNPGPEYANFHTGRGGEGNVHRAEFGGHSGPQKEHKHHEGEGEGKKAGLGEKVKHLLHMDGHGKEKKEKEASREGAPGA